MMCFCLPLFFACSVLPPPLHPTYSTPLQSVAHLNVAHTKLSSLAGLRGITVLNGDLIVWDNNNLTTLQGLGPITQVCVTLMLLKLAQHLHQHTVHALRTATG